MNVRRPTAADLPDVLALCSAADTAVWGDSDWTEADLREEWDELDLERDAWLVELAGRIAGLGWINLLAVRPGWRRRGLGEALLRESFREFFRRGEHTVALGVDSQNPTGATRLYERVGMRVLWEAVVYRKELR